MISCGIRDYMAREWRTARAAKDAYWAERIARCGPLEGFRIADELRRQALLHDPDWPGAAARRQDLLAHVRLAELFTRASPAAVDPIIEEDYSWRDQARNRQTATQSPRYT